MAASWRRILTTADTTGTVTNGSTALPDADAVYDFVVDNYAGTVESVTSGNANLVTIGGTSADPTVTVVTAAIADGGTGLATADQIHSFVTGLGYTNNTGTVESVTSGNANLVTIGGTSADPTVTVVTAAIADGGTGLATADQIHSFVTGLGYTNNTGTVESVTSGNANLVTIGGTSTDPTVTVVTAAIADGGTGLATADQIYDHVTSRISGLTSNAGTVTSVAVDGGNNITDSGGPITDNGTITVNLDTGLTGMVSMAGVDGTGANGSAGDLTFSGGVSTGGGIGGDIFFKTSTVDADGGGTPNTLETAMTIAAATSENADTTVTIHGDLVVNGSTSSVDVQKLTVEDKTIEIAEGAHSDANADGAGLIVDTTTTVANKASFKWVNSSVGISGWEVRDSGASLPQMGVAVLNKYVDDPTISTMPVGSLAFNDGSNSGTAGLYLYIDGA